MKPNLLTLHSTIILSIFLYSLIFYLVMSYLVILVVMSNRRNIGWLGNVLFLWHLLLLFLGVKH